MENLYFFTSLLFGVWIFRNIFFWVALWQLKEYRFDRVMVHLRETRQGKLLLFSPMSLLKWVGLFGYVYIIFNEQVLLWYQLFVSAIYLFEFLFVCRELIIKLAKKPVFTAKAVFILLAGMLFSGLLFVLPLMEPFFWLLVVDRFVAVVIAFFVFCLSFPTEIQRDVRIQQAMDKLERLRQSGKNKLLVIGVTGSYGKSSTKEYTAQILSQHFNVVKTQGTNNTPIGIANTILKRLTEDTEIFVVEMGAYKIGEIAGMCNIVKPTIGILTAVNDQHLSLFGSLQNTMQAKYELIESLPKEGLGLLNGNNLNSFKLAKRSKKPHALYAVKHNGVFPEYFQEGLRPDVVAEDLKVEKTGIAFTVRTKEKTVQLRSPLLGAHSVENMLPGIYIALMLGMSTDEVRKAVKNLVPIEKTMIRKEWKNNITFLDDTFNSNPEAALAAARYVQVYNGKKFYVLQPMIELGSKALDEHYRIATEILKTCDYFLLTNNNYAKAIQKAIAEVDSDCVVKTAYATALSEFIRKHAQKGDVIAFEGKESAFVLEKLLHKT